MHRRRFLQLTGALAAAHLPIIRHVQAGAAPAAFANVDQRIFVNICLDGGPDFRHIIAPPYDANENSFGFQYWKNRASSHAIAETTAAYQDRWATDFTDEGPFGLLNSCGWLREMWQAGNVAIINNVVGSPSRDHSLALLVLEHGDIDTGPHDFGKPGWGGRLASAIGDEASVVALTNKVRRFCYGPNPDNPRGHRNDRVLHIGDSRNFRLFTPEVGSSVMRDSAVMERALKGYYAARRTLEADSSPFKRIFEHERKFREFGDAMADRLLSVPVPPEIEGLYEGDITLNSRYFGRQIRNLYDSLASHDLLKFRVASMEYRGFDTHDNQKRFLEHKMNDLFGSGRAFATLYDCIPTAAADNLVLVFSGEFGRQLRANGDNGTDHGRGNSVIVVGKQVRGGLYGELFPETELARVNQRSPDITGQTAIAHPFAAVCDWVEAGTGDQVFTQRAEAALETGVSPLLFNA